ncbi:MAG: hypothetical protein AAGH76_02955 [Pseudomonadota bacterium]
MPYTLARRVLTVLVLITLAACGGGGGGGPAPTPPAPPPPPDPTALLTFSGSNVDGALRPIVPIASTLLSRANSVGAVLVELTRSQTLVLSTACSGSGSLSVTVVDNGDAQLSAGDSVEIDYQNCIDEYFESAENATIQVDIQDLETADFEEVQVRGTLTRGSQVFDFTYQSTIRGETIVARSSAATTGLELNGLLFTDFQFRRDTQIAALVETFQSGNIALSVVATVQNNSLSGTYSCTTPRAFATGNVLQAGALVCTGNGNTAARLLVEETSPFNIETQLSTDSGQSFSRVDGISRDSIFSSYLLTTFTGAVFDFTLNLPTLPTVRVDLPTKSVAAVAGADYVLALTPSSAVADPNAVVSVNLATGLVDQSVSFATEPEAVAVTPDGAVAYVTFREEPVVRRIDLSTFTVTDTIAIPDDPIDGVQFGRDIAVSPADNNEFVVALWHPATGNLLERFSEAALFRNGIRQPQALPSTDSVNVVRYATDPAIIIGGNTISTGFQVSVVDVVADGLSVRNQIQGYSELVLPFELSNDEVFTTDGQHFDPVTGTLLGEFQARFDQSRFRLTVATDRPNNRVYYYDTVLEVFELDSNAPLASYNTDSQGNVHTLVNASATTLVLATDQQLTIVAKADAREFIDPPCSPADLRDFATGQTYANLRCIYNDLVFSAATNRLYGLLTSINGRDGNSLVEINPDTLAIERTLTVGPEPTHVAVSDAGTSAYVAVEGTGELLWIDLATFTVQQRARFPIDGIFGPLRGGNIRFVPGNESDAVVVTRRRQTTVQYERLSLYQSGIKAIADTSDTFFPDNALEIEFGVSPQFVFGFDSETTARSFSQFEVSSSGIINPTATGIGDGEAFGQMRYANGKFVLSTGDVIDEATLTLEARFEINDSLSVGFSQLLGTDPGTNSVFFFADFRDADTYRTLERYDIDSRRLTGVLQLPRFGTGFGRPLKLVSISNDRLVALFEDNLLVIDGTQIEQR